MGMRNSIIGNGFTSRLRASATLVLQRVGSWKVWAWSGHLWHNVLTKLHESLASTVELLNAYRLCYHEWRGWVRWRFFRFVISMRKLSWLLVSSSSHLATFSVVMMELQSVRRKKLRVWSRELWHYVRTKFYEIPSRHSPVIKCQMIWIMEQCTFAQ
jgi:hypothetical protein